VAVGLLLATAYICATRGKSRCSDRRVDEHDSSPAASARPLSARRRGRSRTAPGEDTHDEAPEDLPLAQQSRLGLGLLPVSRAHTGVEAALGDAHADHLGESREENRVLSWSRRARPSGLVRTPRTGAWGRSSRSLRRRQSTVPRGGGPARCALAVITRLDGSPPDSCLLGDVARFAASRNYTRRAASACTITSPHTSRFRPGLVAARLHARLATVDLPPPPGVGRPP